MKALLPKRRLIPRWRPMTQTMGTGESRSLVDRAPFPFIGDQDALTRAVSTWRAQPSTSNLGEVLAFAVHSQFLPTVLGVADAVRSAGSPITVVQSTLVATLRGEQETQSSEFELPAHDVCQYPFQSKTHELRRLLKIAPSNVLALLDFAQLQSATGKQKGALRSILTALNLAPRNRVVIRTAARFYVHNGEFDKAHSLIRKAILGIEDPWLLASEIALSDLAGKASNSLNRGKRILAESKFRPAHIAELAGAIASAELMAGQMKAARSALRVALASPNGNVMAQALSEQASMGVSLNEPRLQKIIEGSSEARLFTAWQASDADRAESFAMKWHFEEPFSSRPIQFLTTLYSLRGHHEKAARWILIGLRADPKDLGLLTNLAFSSAKLGKFAEAERVIRRLRVIAGDAYEPFLLATEGLISLKQGALLQATEKYRGASMIFQKRKQPALHALCLAHFAKAVSEERPLDAGNLVNEALDAVAKFPTPDALLLLGATDFGSVPNLQPANRRLLSQWIYDKEKNTLTEKTGITSRGAAGLVIKK